MSNHTTDQELIEALKAAESSALTGAAIRFFKAVQHGNTIERLQAALEATGGISTTGLDIVVERHIDEARRHLQLALAMAQ